MVRRELPQFGVENDGGVVKNQQVSESEPNWGEAAHVEFDVRDRAGFVTQARQRVVGLCTKYLQPSETTAQLIMTAQELLENVAKYSSGSGARFDFELRDECGRPTVRMRTENPASPQHLHKAIEMLDEIIAERDPQGLYDRWVAQSGEREGSGLGLIRIRAEAGLTLSYTNEADKLCLEVVGPAPAKRSS
ncbi:MAG TPA: hypothetical protein VFQ61_36515 [Polyangiaceae bacterium]|nr:hypothetical protein [Polyangiaceae bacterium]